VISSRQGAGLVRLVQGALTSAAAPGTVRLGDLLIAHRLVSRAQLEAALSAQRGRTDEVESLGSILLQGRLIDRTQLGKVIFEQALAALGELTSWTEGAFSFHPTDGHEAPPVSFSLQQLVLELMRQRDEAEHRAGPVRN
jgi:hypothetical protein